MLWCVNISWARMCASSNGVSIMTLPLVWEWYDATMFTRLAICRFILCISIRKLSGWLTMCTRLWFGVCVCLCMHVSSRFLWYLPSYLCSEIVIMFRLVYGYRITKCVCFYIDLLPIFSLATSCSVLFLSAFVPFYDCRRFQNASVGRLEDFLLIYLYECQYNKIVNTEKTYVK